jgi:glycosyltransferase involved in cell wall biosynthesis
VCLVSSRLAEARSVELEEFEEMLDGPSRITHELGTNLARLGHHIVAVSDSPRDCLPRLRREYAVKTIGHRFSLENLITFRRTVKEINPDVVHFHGGEPLSVYARLFKASTAIPVVFTFTFIPSLVRQSLRFPSRMMRSLISRAASSRLFASSNFDHVIALTQFAKTRLIRDERLSSDRMSVVRYGVPQSSLQSMNHQNTGDNETVVCISRATDMRGFQTFMSSRRIIQSEYPATEFAVAVRDRKELASAMLQNHEGTKIIGPSELDYSIKSHSIVVMPYSEHIAVDPPISLLECMAWGKQIVSTPIGSIPEALGSDRGLLVPTSNPAALGKAVLQLLRDKRLGRSLAKSAQAFARTTYNWDTATSSIVDIYHHHNSNNGVEPKT